MERAGSWTTRLLLHPSVSGVAVSIVLGLTMDILSTFCGLWCFHGSVCVKLMLRIFEFGVLLFDCFVYRQNVSCLKHFTRYGHYAGGGARHTGNHRQVRSCLLDRYAKNYSFYM